MQLEHFAKATEKEIRRILKTDRARRNHQQVRRVLRQEMTTIGLARVDNPDSTVPVNPKE